MKSPVVLLTGGSRGIGAAISNKLKAGGWSVEAPPRQELDLEQSSSVDSFLERRGNWDGLVLNAGVNEPENFQNISDDSWQRTFTVNVESAFRLLRTIVPGMAGRGFGRIVVLSSLYSIRAREGRAAYSASKASLEALVRSITVEFAGRGVIANGVAPGFVNTELTRNNNSPEAISNLLSRVPVGRLAEPSEIADAVFFLMRPNNEYVSGQVLVVDGGWSCS